jgi:hypothetical protein
MKFFVSDAETGENETFDSMDALDAFLTNKAEELLDASRDPQLYFNRYLTVIQGEQMKINASVNITINIG